MLKSSRMVLIFSFLCAVSARADDVTLKDGSVLKGKVTIETDEKVVLQQDSGRLVLDRSQVASVEKTPAAAPATGAPKPAATEAAPVPAAKEEIGSWPPKTGQVYPDLALRDCNGNLFRLSSLKGKVILLEPVAMTCTACQAFSGGHACGGYLGVAPQPGIDSLEENLTRFGNGLKFDNPGIAYVQVVIFNAKLQAPSVAEVKAERLRPCGNERDDLGENVRHDSRRPPHRQGLRVALRAFRARRRQRPLPRAAPDGGEPCLGLQLRTP